VPRFLQPQLAPIAELPRASLANLPTPIQPLRRLTAALGGPEIWLKRDDLTGLAGGGNKTRKLEFLVGEALESGAETLVTVGALQSNHTRQTAAAAARVGLRCALLHNCWAEDAGPTYRTVGNILFSSLLGATLYHDPTPRQIGDEGHLEALAEHLAAEGRQPYLIPGGASDHPLGGLGYALCAGEILDHEDELGARFDCVIHCTGSSGTQAGLLAGFAATGSATRVIGVADDNELDEKTGRIKRIANQTLEAIASPERIEESQVEVIVADPSAYGVASSETLDAIRTLALCEGIMADPVYEGKALRGLNQLIDAGELNASQRVLLLHLGGTPAIHAYANQLWDGGLSPLPFAES
jgi:1-aminocyclopropane-1-carboxylate deaminase